MVNKGLLGLIYRCWLNIKKDYLEGEKNFYISNFDISIFKGDTQISEDSLKKVIISQRKIILIKNYLNKDISKEKEDLYEMEFNYNEVKECLNKNKKYKF